MTQVYKCPWCRSDIRLRGKLNLNAHGLQSLHCPVCNQEWWISSGSIPQLWEVDKVLNRIEPLTPAKESVQKLPQQLQKAVWSDFQVIPEFLQEPMKNIGKAIAGAGIWVIVVLVLILLIRKAAK